MTRLKNSFLGILTICCFSLAGCGGGGSSTSSTDDSATTANRARSRASINNTSPSNTSTTSPSSSSTTTTPSPSSSTTTTPPATTGSSTPTTPSTSSTTPSSTSSQPTGDVSYTVNTAIIANPERGFYSEPQDCAATALDPVQLKIVREQQGMTLLNCNFYLRSFVNSAIDQKTLTMFQNQMNALRQAGMKTILRFAYSESSDNDATPDQVSSHLDQLAPYIAKNSDVIAVVQAGFIGQWGEWYYTSNFGNLGKISATDWSNRKALVDKLLQVVPSNRMLQLRAPRYKTTMYGTSALTSDEAFSGTARARIGHHNDCFLAPLNDRGTFVNPTVDYPYLTAETNYLPMGGETCELNLPHSDCPDALAELERFHWSFFYYTPTSQPDILQQLKSSGCIPQIQNNLGYRFVLQKGSYTSSTTVGGQLTVNFTVQNQGWAAPFNKRGVELILRNTASGAVFHLDLNTANPRLWLAGKTITVNQSVTLPSNIPAGSYALLLNLPDDASTLSSRPEYSIQLANENVWESSTGFNNLNFTVKVTQ